MNFVGSDDALLRSVTVEPTVARKSVVRRFMSNKIAVASAIILLVITIVAILSPWITPKDPNTQDLVNRLKRPGEHGLLGTDEFGRDVLSRLIVGARVSLMAAGEMTIIAMVLGLPVGMLAGFHGGWFDTLLSRLADSIRSVPFLILTMTVMSVVGYGLGKAMAVVGVVLAPSFYYVARSVTQDVRRETYIEASQAIGCSTTRTLLFHIMPNSLAPLLVHTTVTVCIGISVEASLSFLGLGISPPTASWGGMLRTALTNVSQAPYLVWAPGLVITITVVCMTLFGDGLRDAVGTRRLTKTRRA